MYYHPSMFNEAAFELRSASDRALIQALLQSIEAQQRLQIDALEIVARLGQLSSDSQRHLADLLGRVGAQDRQAAPMRPARPMPPAPVDPSPANRPAREQMRG
jgi:hypothetical protein